ncbi:MAG: hypothetical protein GXP37_00085 [Chloroflexi bacterium]|nr:hypothetical protein [Chloroflexota bacterium]
MSDDADDKVIHSFGERLAIDQALRALADAPTGYERERRARALAEQGMAILPAFLRQLDTENAEMRGGLGILAQYLNRSTISAALRRVAADNKRTPVARVNAITLLERYLDEDVDARLAPDVQTASVIARQNAEEALRMAQTQPHVYLEYAEQLLDEPAEIVHAVIRVISQIENPQKAFLLAAIAAQAPESMVYPILHHLGGLRHAFAYAALSMLAHLLPVATQPLARRQMRKLRMAGVEIDESATLRALWSPIAAGGQSMLWFIRHQPHAASADLLIFLVHHVAGILHVDASAGVAVSDLPYPANTGYEHHVQVSGAMAALHLAEITPAQGLALLAQALHPLPDVDAPWPEELAVYGHWLWGLPAYEDVDPQWPAMPAPAPSVTMADVETLFAHPAFSAWAWTLDWDEGTWQGFSPHDALQQGSSAHQAAIQLLLQPDVIDTLQARLQQQALWLSLVDQIDLAAITLAAVQALAEGQTDHPFVVYFAWRSVLSAAADRATRSVFRLIK